MNLDKTIVDINAAYEAALLKHIAGTAVKDAYDINLSELFFGIEWVAEGNTQRQRWRWLGPRGESHIFLKLSPDTDHLVRIYIHTAASGQVLDALSVRVNGSLCESHGHDWGNGDSLPSHWCVVTRNQIARLGGIAKITYSLLASGAAVPSLEPQAHPATAALTRAIAFSQLISEPYSGNLGALRHERVHPTLQKRLATKLQRILGI